MAMPRKATPIGEIPDLSKGDLITDLAPLYIEVGKFIRAAFGHHVFYGNPFPYPFITSTNPGLIIKPETTGMILFDLATATHVGAIPEGPSLLLEIKLSPYPRMIHPFGEPDDESA
jgi:hypothetical protein